MHSATTLTLRLTRLALGTLLALTLCAFWPARAVAQRAEPSPSAQRAGRLYAEANEAKTQGEWQRALSLLQAAFRILPSVEIAAGLAGVETKLGRHAEAAAHLRYAQLQWSSADGTAVQHELGRALAQAQRHVGRLQLRVLPDAAQVWVGDTASQREVFLPPGRHAILVASPGYHSLRQVVQLQAGQTLNLELVLTPELTGEPAQQVGDSGASGAAPEVATTSRRHPEVLWVGGVTSGLLAGVAGSFSLLSQTAKADLQEHREQQPDAQCSGAESASAFCQELRSRSDRQNARDVWARALWVGFGVAASATVLTYWLWTEPDSESAGGAASGRFSTAKSERAGSYSAVQLGLGPDTAQLQWRGAF